MSTGLTQVAVVLIFLLYVRGFLGVSVAAAGPMPPTRLSDASGTEGKAIRSLGVQMRNTAMRILSRQ